MLGPRFTHVVHFEFLAVDRVRVASHRSPFSTQGSHLPLPQDTTQNTSHVDSKSNWKEFSRAYITSVRNGCVWFGIWNHTSAHTSYIRQKASNTATMLNSQKSSNRLFRLSKKWYHRQHRYAQPSQDVVEENGYFEYHHTFHELSDIEEEARSPSARTVTRSKHGPPPMSVSKMTTRDLGKLCHNTYQHPTRKQDPEVRRERRRELVAAKNKIIFNLACLSITETEELPDGRLTPRPSNPAHDQPSASIRFPSGGRWSRLRRNTKLVTRKPHRNDESNSSPACQRKRTPFKVKRAKIRGCGPRYLHRKMSSTGVISGMRKSQPPSVSYKKRLEGPALAPTRYSSSHHPKSRGLDPEALSSPERYSMWEEQRHIQHSSARQLHEETDFGDMKQSTRLQNIRQGMHLIDFAVRLQALRLLECIKNKMPCRKPDHPSNK